MKVFLTLMSVFLILFLVVTLGIFMPRLNNKVLLKRHQSKVTSQTSGRVATQNVNIYLVALGDEGVSGKKIGCGDSLVPVEQEVQVPDGELSAAINTLLNLKDKYYGESGLYNALSMSHLSLDSARVDNTTAVIKLSGKVSLGGVCDTSRFEEQLRSTALQFPDIKEATIYLNGVELHQALSQK